MPTDVRLKILTDKPTGVVSPRLYGHFAEHLGRCCYDGIWVGKDNTTIEHIGGFRKDVVDALTAMPTPMLRWPGGCYADHYHWRDGIGENRPVRLGLSCGRKVLDDNTLGTHEFLNLCELIGAEPYVAGNMGSGSVQELCDWVEYVNADIPTTLVKERHTNGRKEPWKVKLWGVGNESWGCGGNYDPESYALEYRRYSLMLQHVDPEAELVVVGHETDWNKRCLEKLRHHINFVDHFSIHRYWLSGGPGIDFSDDEYYGLIKEAQDTELFIEETRAFIDAVSEHRDPKRKPVGIALDEWGVWHPEVRTWGPGALATEVNDYTQACTMRDAIATAVCLEVFHRQASSLSMANLAQICNVLHAPVMTDANGAMWVTPTYYVLQMHKVHIGAQAYAVSVEGASLLPTGDSAISATATDGGVTITNRSLTETFTVSVNSANLRTATLLHGDARAENSADQPNAVAPKATDVTVNGDLVSVTIPPCSVITLTA